MKYKVDKKIRPAYLQIYKQIKDDIINGNYEYASKLPSKRLLAEETETQMKVAARPQPTKKRLKAEQRAG